MKFLNKINISVYSIIIIFLSLISGLFKEFIVISIIILFHEFGHFIFLYKYKWNIKEIKIYPFGGVCTLDEKIDKPLKEEFIISIMGLIFQELLFLIVFILRKNLIIDSYIYELFKNYNLAIFLFNLLPIIPLDGSKIFNVIVNKIFNFRVSYMINIIISVLFLSIFFIYFKSDTSYYLIIILLLTQIIYNYKNRYIIFNRFILEKKLYKNEYKDFKKIKNIKKMSRNKRHLIKTNNFYVTEKSYMTNLKK